MDSSSAPLPLSVVTIMRGERRLAEQLATQVTWAEEWHVIDTETEPTPLEAHNLHFHHDPRVLGTEFNTARAVGQKASTPEWLLVLDVDERMPEEGARRLAAMIPELDAAGVKGVWLPRLNFILGQPSKTPDAYPDPQLRFVHRDHVTFPARSHAKYELDGPSRDLSDDDGVAIHHYPFRSTAQILRKVNVYTTIEQRFGAPVARRPSLAALHSAQYFAQRFFRRGGWRDGEVGFHRVLLSSLYQYVVSTKAWERKVAPDALEDEREQLEWQD